MRPAPMPIRSCSRVSNLRKTLALSAILFATAGSAAQSITPPPAGGRYDSQLGGAYDPPAGTVIVSRDRADPPAPGLYNICYVNAFQTQPQETDWWTATHPDLLLRRNGIPVEDANWPGEVLLDTSSTEKRAGLLAVVGQWIAQCAADGYDAIEADNLDTYSRSGKALTIADNLAYARDLADLAHSLDLAFGQKNGAELGPRGRQVGFDFAITESCQVYAECQDYAAVFGRHVLAIEYTDTPTSAFDDNCAARGDEISVIRRDRNLTTPDDPAYFYQAC